MNKKFIISIVVAFVFITIMAFLINYNLNYSSSQGEVSISQEEFNPKIKYIPISNAFLEEYPVVKNLIDELSRNKRSYVDSQEFPEIKTVSNSDAHNLQKAFDDLKLENPGYEKGYRIEYQKEYYHLNVQICYPFCGPYL